MSIGYVCLIDGKSICMCVEQTCVFKRRKVEFLNTMEQELTKKRNLRACCKLHPYMFVCRMLVCVYVCICMYVCVYVYVCICVMCVCVYMCMCLKHTGVEAPGEDP